MNGVIQTSEDFYNPERDGCLLPELLAPEVEKVYWAKLRRFGDRQYEVSVCRPFNLHGERRTKDGARRVKTKTESEQKAADEENVKRSVRRARQGVRGLVKALNADHLVTLSYRENMQDEVRLKRDLKEFVRLVRLRLPEFRYVVTRELQDRGAFHLHMAVAGRQPVKWLRRCWLLAIGQSLQEVNDWYIRDVDLGGRSLGAVNVRGPQKRWGGNGQSWKADRLAGYMTKYIGKDFDDTSKFAKRYWASKEIKKPEVIRLWLGATSFPAALNEAVMLATEQGVASMSIFADEQTGNIWIAASSPHAHNVPLRLPAPF